MFRSRIFSERRDPFGRIDEEKDNEFFAIRSAPFEQNEQKLASLDDSVGRNQANNRRDVAKVETLMTREKQFYVSRTDGPTGIFSAPLESAIKSFQEIKGLKKDGLITPSGETIGSLVRLNTAQIDEGDNGEDGKGDEDENDVPTPDRKPTPPEPKKPEDDGDDKDNECEEKIVWINAQAELFIARQNVNRAQKEKMDLERKKSHKEEELSRIDLTIEKEKKDTRAAKNKGAAAGAVIGGISGSVGGVGGSATGAGIGIGAGSNIGLIIEDIADAIDPNSETSISLGFKKQNLLRIIKDIQKEILGQQNQINNVLGPKVDEARQKEKAAKQAYLECRDRD